MSSSIDDDNIKSEKPVKSEKPQSDLVHKNNDVKNIAAEKIDIRRTYEVNHKKDLSKALRDNMARRKAAKN